MQIASPSATLVLVQSLKAQTPYQTRFCAVLPKRIEACTENNFSPVVSFRNTSIAIDILVNAGYDGGNEDNNQ